MPVNYVTRYIASERELPQWCALARWNTGKEFSIDFTFYKVLIIMLCLWQICAVFSSTLSSDSWNRLQVFKAIWSTKTILIDVCLLNKYDEKSTAALL